MTSDTRLPMLAVVATLSGGVAVAAGAFGAHGAAKAAAELFKTGAQYQLVHVLAALLALRMTDARAAAWLFVIGSWLFAGSLYALALGAAHWIGIVTPFGGAALIGGWITLAIAFVRER